MTEEEQTNTNYRLLNREELLQYQKDTQPIIDKMKKLNEKIKTKIKSDKHFVLDYIHETFAKLDGSICDKEEFKQNQIEIEGKTDSTDVDKILDDFNKEMLPIDGGKRPKNLYKIPEKEKFNTVNTQEILQKRVFLNTGMIDSALKPLPGADKKQKKATPAHKTTKVEMTPNEEIQPKNIKQQRVMLDDKEVVFDISGMDLVNNKFYRERLYNLPAVHTEYKQKMDLLQKELNKSLQKVLKNRTDIITFENQFEKLEKQREMENQIECNRMMEEFSRKYNKGMSNTYK